MQWHRPQNGPFLKFLCKPSDTCALVVTWFWNATVWNHASRSLFLKQGSMLARWQVKKLRRKKEGQVTSVPLVFVPKYWRIMLAYANQSDVRFRRTLRRGVVPSIYPTPSEKQLVQKEKQFKAPKSSAISSP